jgi:hypothetical protein
MLDKEILLDIIRDEYQSEVKEIITNCQFSGKSYLDIDGLNSRLSGLRINNFSDSLDEDDWYELIYEFTPEVYDELSYGKLAA